MRVLTTSLVAIFLAPLWIPDVARAQTTPGSSGSGGETKIGDATFFIAQKLWVAKWETTVVNTVFVPPSASNPAPFQTSNTRVDLEHTIPLTSLGVRIDRWSLSATVSPTTSFGDSRIAGGKLSRSEYDVNLGYALTPNITAALVYKGGKGTVRGLAGSAAPELFASAESRLSGWGAGMNLTAPVTDSLGAYGTFAYVKGRATNNFDEERDHPKYTIVEAGLVYRIPAGFAGLSVQAGYRFQDIRFKADSSITKGFVMGVAVSF